MCSFFWFSWLEMGGGLAAKKIYVVFLTERKLRLFWLYPFFGVQFGTFDKVSQPKPLF